jgi:hypothetical protein
MIGTRVAIENLREISRRCLAGRTLSDEQAKWLGASLARFVDHDCRSTDDAFGLRFPRGGVPWWQEEAIRKRNAAIVELADRFFGHLPMSARVQRIHTLMMRYGASAWVHDRENRDMPERYRGTPKACIWAAFSSGAKMPLTERQLRNILA